MPNTFYQESNPGIDGKFTHTTESRIDLIFRNPLMSYLLSNDNNNGDDVTANGMEKTNLYLLLDKVLDYELRCHSLAEDAISRKNTLKRKVRKNFETIYDGLFDSPLDHIDFCLEAIDYFRDITESSIIKEQNTITMMLKPEDRIERLSKYLGLIDRKIIQNMDDDNHNPCSEKYNQIESNFLRFGDPKYVDSQKQIYKEIITLLKRRKENIKLINDTTSDYMSYKTPDFSENYMPAQLNYLDSGLKLDDEQEKAVVKMLESMENNTINSELSSKKDALDKSLNKVRPIAEALIGSTSEDNNNI